MECAGCGIKEGVSYDIASDYFMCKKCKDTNNYPVFNNDEKTRELMEIAFEIVKIRRIMNETKNSAVLEIYKKAMDELLELQIKIEAY